MKKIILISSLILFGTISFLISCNKDKDDEDPVIVIVSPLENESFQVPDTMTIVADITDNQIIKSVKIAIVDDDKVPLLSTLYYYPDTAFFHLETEYPVDSKIITSGTYDLLIEVSDGTNTKHAYQSIIINELPLKMTGYLLVSDLNSNETRITRLDTVFQEDTAFVLPHDYQLSALSSLWDQFYFISQEPSELIAFSLKESFATDWSVAAGMPNPVYRALSVDEEIFVSTTNGDIWGYNHSGQVTIKTAGLQDIIPEDIAANTLYIFADLYNISGNNHSLGVFHRATGTSNSKTLIEGDIAGIQPLSKNALLFVNHNQYFTIIEVNAYNNSFSDLNEVLGDQVRHVCLADKDHYLISTDNQILTYNFYDNTISFFSVGTPDFIVYEPIGHLAYAVTGNSMAILKYPNGNETGSMTFDHPILNFHIIFNR